MLVEERLKAPESDGAQTFFGRAVKSENFTLTKAFRSNRGSFVAARCKSMMSYRLLSGMRSAK
jgi:hypothetical protein